MPEIRPDLRAAIVLGIQRLCERGLAAALVLRCGVTARPRRAQGRDALEGFSVPVMAWLESRRLAKKYGVANADDVLLLAADIGLAEYAVGFGAGR